jgi:hypothetical protein
VVETVQAWEGVRLVSFKDYETNAVNVDKGQPVVQPIAVQPNPVPIPLRIQPILQPVVQAAVQPEQAAPVQVALNPLLTTS